MNKQLLFPVCIFDFNWTEYNQYKDLLVQYCYDLEKTPIEVAPTAKSNLFESKFNFLDSKDPCVSALADFCYESLWQVAVDMNHHTWGNDFEKSLLIHESWCHITETGGYHDIHRHPGASWCGIFYLKPGESSKDTRNGVNRFYNDIINLHADEGTTYMESYIDVEPTAGKLVIFPAHMAHSALTYIGSTSRIVVAFNARVNNN
jgi:uncharacterized protein (TIGR02466 family)